MPNLRSTRSREILPKNIDEKKENHSSVEKDQPTKKTRAGRANSKENRSNLLKEKNCEEINQVNTTKNTRTRQSNKTKMMGEDGNAQVNGVADSVTSEIKPEVLRLQQNPTEKPMDITECSPSKKQKLNADDDEDYGSEVFFNTSNGSSCDPDVTQDSNLRRDGTTKNEDRHDEIINSNDEEILTNKKTTMPQNEGRETFSNQVNETDALQVSELRDKDGENKGKLCMEKDKPSTSNTASKSRSISLKSQNNANKDSEELSASNSNLPKQLLTVISNLYLNVGERLHLDFPPRCLDDLAFCHRHHYRSDLPEAPMTSQAHSLRSALQHYRYVLFINATTDMCHRGEFPGKGIFTKLIELVLSINYATKQPNVNIPIYQQSYHKSIALFSMIVRTFPPCWHKMRFCYVGFLEYGLDSTKIKSNKDETISKTKIFDILLDLLEEALKNSKPEDITTSKSETLQRPKNTNSEGATSPLPNTELSICGDYWNQNEYEEKERQKQTFEALPMDQKFERIFTALRLLLQILENDLAMWMLHHNKKTKEWIFSSENRPLIVVLCELTQYTRNTRVARRIFSIYSEATAKNMCKQRLKVLERYIALLMVASNTADMENTAIGVKYPFLGDQTKTLIYEFFKIFKANNRENISKYMETINILRIPYVRYEFIDNVLIMFRFTDSEPLTPQKIALDIAKKRWLKYKPACELSKPDEDISREQYLHLLLDALRSYCEFHGSKTFLHAITDIQKVSPLTTTNDSVHRWPIHGSGVFVLKKMAKDISKLESQLKMTVRMSKPKVDLPLADICIDEAIILKYRNDLKFIVSLQNVLLKQNETYPDVDFTEWLEYLNKFSPKKPEKEETK